MEDYPGNSRNAKPNKSESAEPKKIDKVVEGKVIRRKKPLGKRFMETFVGGGDARSVWGYVFEDVLVPAAKNMISDAVSQGFERMLFGDVRSRHGSSRPPTRGGPGYVSYNRYASAAPMVSRRDEPRREMSRRARATHDFDEIILETKVEAEEVIDGLFNLISQFEVATVADLYELLGQNASYTDAKYGWTDIRGANVAHVKGGYLLDLPRPESID